MLKVMAITMIVNVINGGDYVGVVVTMWAVGMVIAMTHITMMTADVLMTLLCILIVKHVHRLAPVGQENQPSRIF
jgi:Na+/serine symporter